MRNNDIEILNQLYILEKYESDLISSLDEILIHEGIGDSPYIKKFIDSTNTGYNTVKQTVSDGIDKTHDTVQAISQLPEKLNMLTPENFQVFLDKFVEYIYTILQVGVTGGIATYAIGKLLMVLSKRLSNESMMNRELMMNLLPDSVKSEVENIEHLKNSNPSEYRVQVFKINKNALKEFKKSLNKSGIKTTEGVLPKVLDFMGKTLSSATGSIVGAIILVYIIQKLGYNPLPVFGQ
jgi:hypothetical protein